MFKYTYTYISLHDRTQVAVSLHVYKIYNLY